MPKPKMTLPPKAPLRMFFVDQLNRPHEHLAPASAYFTDNGSPLLATSGSPQWKVVMSACDQKPKFATHFTSAANGDMMSAGEAMTTAVRLC